MDNERTLDARLIDLLAYFITGTDVLLNFVKVWGSLHLGEELTKEQKAAVKKDLEWTNDAIMYIGKAGRDFRALNKDIELLSAALNKKLDFSIYDELSKGTNEIVAVCLAYMTKIEGNVEAAREIRNFLLNVGVPIDGDVRTAYEYFMTKSVKL